MDVTLALYDINALRGIIETALAVMVVLCLLSCFRQPGKFLAELFGREKQDQVNSLRKTRTPRKKIKRVKKRRRGR